VFNKQKVKDFDLYFITKINHIMQAFSRKKTKENKNNKQPGYYFKGG